MMRQGIREAGRQPAGGRKAPWAWSALLVLLGALPAGATSVMAEVSASSSYRTWTLLGDVELHRDGTFLTLGYTGARVESETALSHQLSAGVDHALSDHWMLSGMALVGLPKASLHRLAPERPELSLPALGARTGYRSLGGVLTAVYDSAGISDVEWGLDLGVGLTHYVLFRQLLGRREDASAILYQRAEPLLVARPTAGVRLLLVDRWELGLRGGYSLYSGDPLSVGQFTAQEMDALLQRYVNTREAEGTLSRWALLRRQELAMDLAGRLLEVSAMTGLPSAPVLFDVKPSVTYRFSAAVRGQVSYGFTRYVPTQGYAHVLSTRWTFRPWEPFRLWVAVAVQSDQPEEGEALRTGLLTLGSEYTF